jgi:molybdopterin synthase sulfur carrier subunit
MTEVEVRLFGILRGLHPGLKHDEAIRVTLPDQATVAELLEALCAPPATVKIVFVNGVICDTDQTLFEGDRVGVFPPIAGG